MSQGWDVTLLLRPLCRGSGLRSLVCGLLPLAAPAGIRAEGPLPFAEGSPRRQTAAPAPLEQAGWHVESPLGRTLPARNRPVAADEITAPRRPAATQAGSLWVTLTIVLVTFLGLALVTRWLKTHGPARFRALPGEALELLGGRTLEPRVTVHLVRCGGRILMLGVAPDGVRTLAEYTDPVEVDLLAGACRSNADNGVAQSFGTLFTQTSKSKPAPESRAGEFVMPSSLERTHA
jgi:flagellar biogenesis protein FliO